MRRTKRSERRYRPIRQHPPPPPAAHSGSAASRSLRLHLRHRLPRPPASSASALAAHRRRLPTPPPTPAAHSASVSAGRPLRLRHRLPWRAANEPRRALTRRGGGTGAAAGAPAWLGRPSQRQTRTGEGTGWQRERWGGGDHDDGRSSGAGDGSRRIEVMTDGRLLSRVSLPSFSEVHHRAASSSSPSAVAAVAVHPNLLASRPQPSTPTSSPHACRRRPPPAPDPTHRRPPPARTR